MKLAIVLLALWQTALTSLVSSAHQTVLVWQPSPTVGATYNVKRAFVSGGPYTTLKSGVTVPWYIDAGLPANVKVCYVVTAQSGTQESTPSNESCGITGANGLLLRCPSGILSNSCTITAQ